MKDFTIQSPFHVISYLNVLTTLFSCQKIIILLLKFHLKSLYHRYIFVRRAVCHEGRASSTKFINPLIRCQTQSHPVIAIRGQCGENEKMHNAIEDLYILYIEETLSIIVVYTIHSSRPQSFPLSIYTLCTIPHSAACISPAILIYCFCISPFSIRPGRVLPWQSPRLLPTRIQQS